MRPAQQYLLAATLTSLDEHPDDWSFTGHEAKNEKLDIQIWMSNRYYATRIDGPGVMCGEKQCSLSFLQHLTRQRI